MKDKTARIWRAFGGERDNSRQKSRFRERKVVRKPGMLPQTNLLKCTRSSWQFSFIWEAGRDVKRDLAMHVYISYLSRSVYMERRSLPGRFPSRPGKAGSRLKRNDFYHIMLTLQIVRVKSSRVETFSCKPEMISVLSRYTFRPALI